jgi:hypothetical protein
MKLIHALAVSLLAAVPLAAQVPGCPYERAANVAASWVNGPGGPCGSGIEMKIGGVAIRTPQTFCPLFVVITPAHEVAERNDRPTRTKVVGQSAEQTAFFTCDNDYFLIFSIGSSCVFQRIVITGAVNRLVTEACVQAEL